MQQISAAKGKFIGSVERYDNSDQSKFPVFRSALMRACGKMSCSGEVLGIMKEHVADDGCMLLPPSVISDQAYLEKFKQHWCLPCVGADLVQRHLFLANVRERTANWKNRQRYLYDEILNYFHEDALPTIEVAIENKINEDLERVRVQFAGHANPMLLQIAERLVQDPQPRRIIV